MKRKLMLLSLTTMVVLSASACSSTERNSAGTPKDDSGAGSAKDNTAAVSLVKPKPELKGKVRIGFVGLNEQTAPDPLTGETVYGADELKKRLKQDYPNLDFEIIVYPYKDHQAKAKALVESGQIDVSVESDSKFMWNQGLSQDLTAWETKDKEWSKDAYISPSLLTGPLEVDKDGNKINNALPIAVDGSGIYFDKNIFADYGVTPLSENPTWDEVLEKAKKLTGKDPKTGEQTYGIYTRIPSDQAGYTATLIANSYGGDMGKMGPKEYLNQVTLNSPEMIKAADTFKSFMPYMPPGTVQGQGGEKWGTTKNNIAIYMNLPAIQLQKFRSLKMLDRYDVAMIPKGPNGTGGFLGGVRVQMVKNAQDKDLAWEIVKWMSIGNGQRFLWETKTMLPVSTKALGTSYKPDATDDKIFKMVGQAQYMSPIWFTTAKFSLTRAMEKVLLKDTPAKDALDTAQKEVQDEFAKMKAADQK